VTVEWSRSPGSMARRAKECESFATKFSKLDDCDCEYRKVVRCCRSQASSHHSQGVLDDGVNEAVVSTAAPDRSAVLCG